ncbi:hypothetical protein SETIT_6G070800v2 [Setaria italica]|uniref:F-box domain-containing protein n=1 Tax=Setaria italica TaxID=4555 RepID=A0A368RIX5_SETIT|nr:F-box protein At1g60400 [Setaria italica]RCV30147.1 hypothetical protein SETIT_6G070800v2 [Setaria italica]
MERRSGVRDALAPPPTPSISFRMEALPEEIQLLVLSLLSLKDAARASTVSRNWRKLWTWHPNLCFDGTKSGSADEDSVKIEKAKFIETVNAIIQQHSGIGLNKFSIRCSLQNNSSDHLDRWICFASAAKAKIIDLNLQPKRNDACRTENVYHFPLEALSAQGFPFIQSLFLTNVSIEALSDICSFTKLRRLHLHHVQIIGDLPGLLLNCSILEDLELIACSGVADLNITHQLAKLRHLLISNMCVHKVDFHVAGLTHFGYKGDVIPIVLHGCTKLEKVTLTFQMPLHEQVSNKGLGHAITGIPSISAVKELNIRAYMQEDQPIWSSQVPRMTRPTFMFVNLRHLTCEITIFTNSPNTHTGILQLAHCLDCAPQLETLKLHMQYHVMGSRCWPGEGILPMRRLDHLKTVYMSGFRCYRPQVELLHGILENGAALEHVTIEPTVTLYVDSIANIGVPEDKICEWAHRASERFGKAITVVKAHRRRWS